MCLAAGSITVETTAQTVIGAASERNAVSAFGRLGPAESYAKFKLDSTGVRVSLEKFALLFEFNFER